MILIDVGSSSVKVYDGPKLIKTKTLLLKTDFETAKTELYKLISEIQDKNVRVFGTSFFRKLEPGIKDSFLQEFKKRTGLDFVIISQDQENYYLQEALIHKYSGKALLINIGGGSTELVVVENKQALERKNIDLGVVAILKQFPQINESLSGVTLAEVKDFVLLRLPELENKVDLAFYSGGELRYMQLARYKLQPNDLFSDLEHPKTISVSDFKKRNSEIFEKITLEDLEKLMPDDPVWMHGARACSVFAEAICEKYQIETIVPSNANLVNGILSTLG